MIQRTVVAILLALGVLGSTGCRRRRSPEPPVIAAAADLRFALEAIAQDFKQETGLSVRLTFGSSGNLARQIEQGAPYQVFLSADEDFISRLQRAGRTEDGGVRYGIGRIGWFIPKGSPVAPAGGPAAISSALKEGHLRAFALANPDHAPYGMRGREALRHAGLWEPLKPHLVLGENIAQAAQFTLTGEAQAGIIAYSLALAPTFRDRGHFELIPETWHQPLAQRMVLIRGAGPDARRFFAFLQESQARATLRRFGFVLPGDGPA